MVRQPGNKLANGNGNGNTLGLINSGAIALLIAIMAGFWSLADPRGEIKSIRESYLSLREHNVFVEHVTQNIARIDKLNLEQQRDHMTLREWHAWKVERDVLITSIQKRLDMAITHTELDTLIAKHQVAIDSLRREMDQIDKALNARVAAWGVPIPPRLP